MSKNCPQKPSVSSYQYLATLSRSMSSRIRWCIACTSGGKRDTPSTSSRARWCIACACLGKCDTPSMSCGIQWCIMIHHRFLARLRSMRSCCQYLQATTNVCLLLWLFLPPRYVNCFSTGSYCRVRCHTRKLSDTGVPAASCRRCSSK